MNTEISITDLSYDERLFLLSYKSIVRKEYQFQDTNRDTENISLDHVQAQKIGYTLCRLQLMNNYCFSWNKRGPFSSKFQELLTGLDAKSALVEQFYKESGQESLEELLPGCLTDMLDQVGQAFHAYTSGDSNTTDDLELLGSLLYICTTVLPGQDFDQVNSELQSRKSTFTDREKNLKAWDCLNSAGLISV